VALPQTDCYPPPLQYNASLLSLETKGAFPFHTHGANTMTQLETPALSEIPKPKERLYSLDILRGFDMFWIVGGVTLFKHIAKSTPYQWVPDFVYQWMLDFTPEFRHVRWEGFTWYDFIFPLFLFLSGVTIPFSLLSQRARGVRYRSIYRKIIQRTILLVFLGVMYNGGIRNFEDLSTTRFASVLGFIGISWCFAAIITLHCNTRGIVLWTAGLLLGFWAAMVWVPVPGFGAGDLTPKGNLVGYLDRCFLLGKTHRGAYDPQGVFLLVTGTATALFGVLTGLWLRREGYSKLTKAAGMLLAGGVLLGLGKWWGMHFLICKEIWTSSLVVYTAGWSLVFLSITYLIVDVWGLKKWAFFFKVIGTNSIAIYLACHFLDFRNTARAFFDSTIKLCDDKTIRAPLFTASTILVWWLIFLYFYRKKLFIRV
jgi:predicted acyltransferase